MHGSPTPHQSLDYAPGDPAQDDADVLAGQAARCRRLAAAIFDRATSETLSRLAECYERDAALRRREA